MPPARPLRLRDQLAQRPAIDLGQAAVRQGHLHKPRPGRHRINAKGHPPLPRRRDLGELTGAGVELADGWLLGNPVRRSHLGFIVGVTRERDAGEPAPAVAEQQRWTQIRKLQIVPDGQCVRCVGSGWLRPRCGRLRPGCGRSRGGAAGRLRRGQQGRELAVVVKCQRRAGHGDRRLRRVQIPPIVEEGASRGENVMPEMSRRRVESGVRRQQHQRRGRAGPPHIEQPGPIDQTNHISRRKRPQPGPLPSPSRHGSRPPIRQIEVDNKGATPVTGRPPGDNLARRTGPDRPRMTQHRAVISHPPRRSPGGNGIPVLVINRVADPEDAAVGVPELRRLPKDMLNVVLVVRLFGRSVFVVALLVLVVLVAVRRFVGVLPVALLVRGVLGFGVLDLAAVAFLRFVGRGGG